MTAYLAPAISFDQLDDVPDLHADDRSQRLGCFCGRYPLEGTSEANGKYALETVVAGG
jgi:hypothetical protein